MTIQSLATKEIYDWEDALEKLYARLSPGYVYAMRHIFQHFRNFLDDRGVYFLLAQTPDAMDFMDYWQRADNPNRLGKEASKTTLANVAQTLKTIWRQLKLYDFVKVNIFALVCDTYRRDEEKRRPTRLIPFDSIPLILAAPSAFTKAGIRDRALYSVQLGTGARISETLNLTLASLQTSFDGIPFLEFKKTKGGKTREIALSDWVLEAVRALHVMRTEEGAKPGDKLFKEYDAAGNVIHPLLYRTALRDFKKVCKENGLPEFGLHCARATAVTKLLADGVPHRLVQEFSGHSSIKMVELYDKRRMALSESPALKLFYGNKKPG